MKNAWFLSTWQKKEKFPLFLKTTLTFPTIIFIQHIHTYNTNRKWQLNICDLQTYATWFLLYAPAARVYMCELLRSNKFWLLINFHANNSLLWPQSPNTKFIFLLACVRKFLCDFIALFYREERTKFPLESVKKFVINL